MSYASMLGARTAEDRLKIRTTKLKDNGSLIYSFQSALKEHNAVLNKLSFL